ncbi:MAG TPA: twin-arginine translocase subunit TatC, partial [Firmicutes bacterium]|nr:twin-arginine translocase subunit TatC [Bacillota bacterium]
MEKERAIRLIEELRRRLIVIAAIVFILAIIGFSFADRIRELLLLPAEMSYAGLEDTGFDLQLIFLTPAEAFLANIKLAFIAGTAVALPVILYQLLAMATAVAGMKKRIALFLTLIMYFLFALGVAFAYFVVLPFALNFFVGFSGADLVPNFSITRYISFTSSFIFSFGFVFQLPVLFWFLGSLGILHPVFLRRNRKYALLIIVVFAAVLTPPDVFSQVLMAIPLMLLYELGIFMVYLARRREIKESSSGQPADSSDT